MKAAHYEHSSLRERIVEHVFVGETLKKLWDWDVFDVEVLRSEFDAHGYDLVLSRGKVVRHIQFKTETKNRPDKVSVSSALAEKNGGCVIWIKVDDALNMGPYFWLGGAPGMVLSSIKAHRAPKRATHNAQSERPERRNHHLVPGSAFSKIEDFDVLLRVLLGDLPNPSAGDQSLIDAAWQNH